MAQLEVVMNNKFIVEDNEKEWVKQDRENDEALWEGESQLEQQNSFKIE